MQQVMKTQDKLIQVSQVFDKSPEDVWSAITNHQEMIQWYFANIPEFKAEVGFKTQFNIENEGRNFIHLWKVLKVEVNKKIIYNWRFKDYIGDSNVEFEIFKQNDKSLLTVSCHILEDFEEGIPEFSTESCEAGWKYFIQQSLNNYFVKNEI